MAPSKPPEPRLPAMPALRLIFMGTPEFSVPALTALRAAGHQVVAVYTQPPRPAHRGQKETPSPVHRAALAQGIPVFVPKSLKRPEAQAEFLAHGADVAVVVAYGLLLPPAILAAPRLGCFNIHASLLPRWRGAAPIQHALLSGDAETGICIMKMDAGLDTGPVALRAATAITAEDTAQSLHDRLSTLGAEQIVRAMALLCAGDLPLTPQPETGETYARKLSKEDGRLDFAASAKSLARQVRALTPWPGCWFALKGQKEQRLKVLAAEALAAEALPSSSAPLKPEPGTLLSSDFTLATGDGVLKLTRVAREGRAPMDGLSCLRGLPYKVGENILAGPSAGKGWP